MNNINIRRHLRKRYVYLNVVDPISTYNSYTRIKRHYALGCFSSIYYFVKILFIAITSFWNPYIILHIRIHTLLPWNRVQVVKEAEYASLEYPVQFDKQ